MKQYHFYWLQNSKLKSRISNYRLNEVRILEPGYTCVITFQILPIAVRPKKRGLIRIGFQFTRVNESIFHFISETIFKELSFSMLVPSVEKQAPISGGNNAGSLSNAPYFRFRSVLDSPLSYGVRSSSDNFTYQCVYVCPPTVLSRVEIQTNQQVEQNAPHEKRRIT